MASIGVPGEQPDRRLVEAATDLVDTISERPAGTAAALYRFGNTLGADGWQIAQADHWVHVLGELVDHRRRRQLARYSSHAALAQGWADGYVRGAHTAKCIDPTTGLATTMVLHNRLREVYDQGVASGTPPSDLCTLVLIDVDASGLPRLETGLLLACVADTVHDLFDQGETIASAGTRIVVLAETGAATRQRAETLAGRLRVTPSTRRAHATVALEALPVAPPSLGGYVRDLVG